MKIGFFRVLFNYPKRSLKALVVVFHFLLFSDFVNGQFYTGGVTAPNCFGGTGNASLTINPGGCSFPLYTYRISTINNFTTGQAFATSNPTSATTYTFYNLQPNTYYIRVYNASNNSYCSGSQVTINIPNPPSISAVESVLDVECYGENSGGLNITVSGGTPDYQFQLYYNGTPVGLPQTLTNEPVDLIANYSQLGAGTYTYLISDYYGCEFEDSVEINSPQAINPTITSYNLPCNGGFGLINISSLSNIDGTPGQTGFNI